MASKDSWVMGLSRVAEEYASANKIDQMLVTGYEAVQSRRKLIQEVGLDKVMKHVCTVANETDLLATRVCVYGFSGW